MQEQDRGIEQMRQTLGRSVDPRAERTRSAIVAAVRALSDAGEDVTVTSIGRTAGVSRATFYAHYAGLEGLARGLRQEAFRSLDDMFRFDIHTTADALRLSHVRVVAHYADHRALYAAVAAVPVSKASHLASIRAWAEIIDESLHDHPRRPPGLRTDSMAQYIAAGAFTLLEAWVSGEIVMTETEIIDQMLEFLPDWLDTPY